MAHIEPPDKRSIDAFIKGRMISKVQSSIADYMWLLLSCSSLLDMDRCSKDVTVGSLRTLREKKTDMQWYAYQIWMFSNASIWCFSHCNMNIPCQHAATCSHIQPTDEVNSTCMWVRLNKGVVPSSRGRNDFRSCGRPLWIFVLSKKKVVEAIHEILICLWCSRVEKQLRPQSLEDPEPEIQTCNIAQENLW